MFKKVFLLLFLVFSVNSFAADFDNSKSNIFFEIEMTDINIWNENFFETKLANAIQHESDLAQTYEVLRRWLKSDFLSQRIDRAAILMRVIEKMQHKYYFGIDLYNKKISFYELLDDAYRKLDWASQQCSAYNALKEWRQMRSQYYRHSQNYSY